MEKYNEAKLRQIDSDRRQLHPRFMENCATYPTFLELEQKAFREGEISCKHKELMALAISLVTKCEPCIEWHVQQAWKAGASDWEVYETIDVAIEMGGGPAAAYARLALRALDYYKASDVKGR